MAQGTYCLDEDDELLDDTSIASLEKALKEATRMHKTCNKGSAAQHECAERISRLEEMKTSLKPVAERV